jgi:hypothetical protein
MADQTKDHDMEGTEMSAAGAVDKGKGKAAQVADPMESADDSSSGEDSGAENEVCLLLRLTTAWRELPC